MACVQDRKFYEIFDPSNNNKQSTKLKWESMEIPPMNAHNSKFKTNKSNLKEKRSIRVPLRKKSLKYNFCV